LAQGHDRAVHLRERRLLQDNKEISERAYRQTDYDLFPAELAEKYRKDDAWVMATGKTLEATEQHLTARGDTLHVRIVKLPVHGGQGLIVGTQGMFWDVSDRRHLEEALAQTVEELDLVKQQLREATARRS
jgi:hypothetical protein